MATRQLAIPAFTLAADRLFPPLTLPAGLSAFVLTLDVSLMLPGQVLWLRIEGSPDGTQWFRLVEADFDGPWTDPRTGLVRTDVALAFNLGSRADGTPRTSQAGWQLRAGARPVNGPIQVASGTLSAQ